jgi:hypothetical protein
MAGRPAPVYGDLCPLRPASSGARFGLLSHLSPLKRSEPRTGHRAGRAGLLGRFASSTHAGFRRARVSARHRLQEPPEAQVRLDPRRRRRFPPMTARNRPDERLRWAGTAVYRTIFRRSQLVFASARIVLLTACMSSCRRRSLAAKPGASRPRARRRRLNESKPLRCFQTTLLHLLIAGDARRACHSSGRVCRRSAADTLAGVRMNKRAD